jgi:hypothetical protein
MSFLLSPTITTAPECFHHVVSYLTGKQLYNMLQVNSEWHNILDDDSVWRHLCVNHVIIPDRDYWVHKPLNHSWKQSLQLVIRQQHVREKNRERSIQRQRSLRIACGRRGKPNVPMIRALNPNTCPNTLSSVWVHPDSRPDTITIDILSKHKVAEKVAHPYMRLAARNLISMETNLIVYGIQKLIVSEDPKQSRLIDGMVSRYIQFMKLKAKYPEAYLVPTHDIEIVWQSHMLRPSLYESDCTSVFGAKYIIPHKLYRDELENAVFELALRETAELWKKEYNCDYLLYPLSSIDLVQQYNEVMEKMFSFAPFSSINYIEPRSTYFMDTPHSRLKKDTPDASIVPELSPYTPLTDKMLQEWKQFIEKFASASFKNPLHISTSDVHSDRNWIGLFNNFMGQYWQLNTDSYFKCLKGYERFLYLNAKYAGQLQSGNESIVHPTYAIDLFWHVHMLHPVEYKENCLKYVGEVLDHEPWPDKNESTLDNHFQQVDDIWQREYKNSMECEHKLRYSYEDTLYAHFNN